MVHFPQTTNCVYPPQMVLSDSPPSNYSAQLRHNRHSESAPAIGFYNTWPLCPASWLAAHESYIWH